MQIRKKVYSKNTIIKIFILFLVLFVVQKVINANIIKKNNQAMKQTIQSINNNENTVLLNEIVPFQWDYIYTFTPYYPKWGAYGSLGYKVVKYVEEGWSEDFLQMIFVKNGKVICNLKGYAHNVGYNFYFNTDKSKDGILTITKEENRKMKINKIENMIIFEEKS